MQQKKQDMILGSIALVWHMNRQDLMSDLQMVLLQMYSKRVSPLSEYSMTIRKCFFVQDNTHYGTICVSDVREQLAASLCWTLITRCLPLP